MPIDASEIEVDSECPWEGPDKGITRCSICKTTLDFDYRDHACIGSCESHTVQECLNNLAERIQLLEDRATCKCGGNG